VKNPRAKVLDLDIRISPSFMRASEEQEQKEKARRSRIK